MKERICLNNFLIQGIKVSPESSCPFGFSSCFNFSAVLVVRLTFPFGVWGRMWNSTVSVPDHCRFIYFSYVCKCIHSVSQKSIYSTNYVKGQLMKISIYRGFSIFCHEYDFYFIAIHDFFFPSQDEIKVI